MCPFLPDSPRLLIRKGKHQEALEVLAALEGHGATPDSSIIHTQYNIIKDVLDKEHAQTYSWWKLITGRGPSGVLRRMILGAWMQAMNQISGMSRPECQALSRDSDASAQHIDGPLRSASL